MEALAIDLDIAAASQHHEHLLLAGFPRGRAPGYCVAFGGMSITCMPNDSTPSVARARLNEPNMTASMSSIGVTV